MNRESEMDNAILQLFNSPTVLQRRVHELTSPGTAQRMADGGPIFTAERIRALRRFLSSYLALYESVLQLQAVLRHADRLTASEVEDAREAAALIVRLYAAYEPAMDGLVKLMAKRARCINMVRECCDALEDGVFQAEVENAIG